MENKLINDFIGRVLQSSEASQPLTVNFLFPSVSHTGVSRNRKSRMLASRLCSIQSVDQTGWLRPAPVTLVPESFAKEAAGRGTAANSQAAALPALTMCAEEFSTGNVCTVGSSCMSGPSPAAISLNNPLS